MNKIFKIILITYISAAFLGAFILNFDIMRTKDIAFLDLLFNTVSAVCVTGLAVSNIATDYTIYGQMVILILIQIGGFGFMTIAGIFFLLIGRNIDFGHTKLVKEQICYPSFPDVMKFAIKILYFVVVLELIGTIILGAVFMEDMPIKKALWYGLFHSVSALNNAGFSIFESNLVSYRANLIVNLTIIFLVIAGGLGFVVVDECIKFYKKRILRLSIHTRIVLISSVFLTLFGAIFVLIFEWDNAEFSHLNLYEKVLASLFYSVNLRTSGFNTIDVSLLNDQTLFFSSFLMIIGAGPGGTAGGIKTVTVVVLFLYTYNTLKNRDCIIMQRRISDKTIQKSFIILVVAMFYIMISVILFSIFEDRHNKQFLQILYEICSAFGTVGLSTGDGGNLSLSANFSGFGKIYLITLMFIGRMGVFAFSIAVLGKNKKSRIDYPVEEVIL